MSKGQVYKIEEEDVEVARWSGQVRFAYVRLDDGTEIKVNVWDNIQRAESRRYFNVVPHEDWIREGMSVKVSRDYEGWILMRD